jgi:hypothetical protein
MNRLICVHAMISCFISSGTLLGADTPKLPDPTGTIAFKEPGMIGRVLTDDSADLWFVENCAGLHPYHSSGGGGLWLLTEKGWVETPVKQMPRPSWGARFGPPWMKWAAPVAAIAGKNGSMLAVVTRDIYQEMVKSLPKDNTHWDVSRLEEEKHKNQAEKMWLEGWLRKQGKWIGPMRLEKLLKEERDVIRKDFQDSRSLHMHFDLMSDGQATWTVFNGQLTADDGEKVVQHVLSGNERLGKYMLAGHDLFRHPDGIWCIARSNEGFVISAVSLKEDRIVTKEIPELRYRSHVSHVWQLPHLHVTKDKQTIAWVHESGPATIHPYFLKDGAWKRRDDLGEFFVEEGDGSLWFEPIDRWKDTTGYVVLNGDKMETFPMPKTWVQSLNLAGEKKRYARYQFDSQKGIKHRIAELTATGKQGAAGWKMEAVYAIDSHPHMPTHLIADKWGNLVSEYGAIGTLKRNLKQ